MKVENAPDEGQQAENVSLESALSEEFDRQAEMDDSEVEQEVFEDQGIEEEEDAEVEVSSEEDEEISEEAEGQEETVGDEVQDYNEPAPERWPEDIRTAYNALPPEAKRVMLEQIYKPMQRSFTEKTQEMAAMRKGLGPMVETMQRHQKEFEQAGVDPVEAFNRQMAWSAHFAKVGPEQGAKDLANAYGQVGTGQQQDVYLTPVERQQQARIDNLQSQVDQNTQYNENQAQQVNQEAINARTQQVRGSISKFANEMRNGKPIHPHVEKVSAQMAGLIRGGLVHRTNEYGQPVPYEQQLGQAYQLACEMDPSIRGVRDTRTRKEQVTRAHKANREVVSKVPAGDVNVEDTGSLSDSLSDLYDKLDRSAA